MKNKINEHLKQTDNRRMKQIIIKMYQNTKPKTVDWNKQRNVADIIQYNDIKK